MAMPSATISVTIERDVAPSALRMPISLVRSATEIKRMLPTPMAAASSVPMPTTQMKPRIQVNTSVTARNSSRLFCTRIARRSSG